MVNDIEFKAAFREWAERIAPMMFDYRVELMKAGFPEPSADYLVAKFIEYLIEFEEDEAE